ncbi:MerR family transcriptional regulator [Weizmannia ginsengihumi]|nr:MerR family transcriptional regulator [Heyndrickxia ginsengihumi]
MDYYTHLGLLQPKRSNANYRIYDEEALEDLKFIVECKHLHFPLETIRQKMEWRKNNELNEKLLAQQVDLFSEQMKKLNIELSQFVPSLEKLSDDQKHTLCKRLSKDSMALVESLSLLLTKQVVGHS